MMRSAWWDVWWRWVVCEEPEADWRGEYRWLLAVGAPFGMLLAMAEAGEWAEVGA